MNDTVTVEKNSPNPKLSDKHLSIMSQMQLLNSWEGQRLDDRVFLSIQSCPASGNISDSSVLDATQIYVCKPGWGSIEWWSRVENTESVKVVDAMGWQNETSGNTDWLASARFGYIPYSLVPSVVPVDISARLDELRSIQDGWLDGDGIAPSSKGLDWLQENATQHLGYSHIPYIYPTPEGGVQIEWDIGPFRPSLEIDLETRVGEWHCLDLKKDESFERELQLDCLLHWQWIVNELHQLQIQAT